MEKFEHDYILRNIQDAHESQIEHILQHLNAGNIDGAKYICETLLNIYKLKKEEKQNG